MKELTEVCKQFLINVVDSVIKQLPRNNNKWVYGALGGFRDNPKYLFYQARERHPEIRSIWISPNKDEVKIIRKHGGEAYYYHSLRGLYHIMTSRVAVCDHTLRDISRFFTGGVYYVNLWHGSSVKRVRWQAPDYFVRRFRLKSAEEMHTSFRLRMLQYHVLYKVPDLCLAPSVIQAEEFFAPMMNIPLEHCLVGVYPRSQLLINGKEEAMEFIDKYEPDTTIDFVRKLSAYNKTYIYMPTWRNDGVDFIKKAGIDWGELNEMLSQKNELLVLKFHPFTSIDSDAVSGFCNIVLYPSNSDIYTVLPFIDCLITDYSSIYTDFLIMNKEVILFVFDYNDYVKGSYDLEDFDEFYVGMRAYNFMQLLKVMESGVDCHVPKEHYHRLMDFFWSSNQYHIDIVEEIKRRTSR